MPRDHCAIELRADRLSARRDRGVLERRRGGAESRGCFASPAETHGRRDPRLAHGVRIGRAERPPRRQVRRVARVARSTRDRRPCRERSAVHLGLELGRDLLPRERDRGRDPRGGVAGEIAGREVERDDEAPSSGVRGRRHLLELGRRFEPTQPSRERSTRVAERLCRPHRVLRRVRARGERHPRPTRWDIAGRVVRARVPRQGDHRDWSGSARPRRSARQCARDGVGERLAPRGRHRDSPQPDRGSPPRLERLDVWSLDLSRRPRSAVGPGRRHHLRFTRGRLRERGIGEWAAGEHRELASHAGQVGRSHGGEQRGAERLRERRGFRVARRETARAKPGTARDHAHGPIDARLHQRRQRRGDLRAELRHDPFGGYGDGDGPPWIPLARDDRYRRTPLDASQIAPGARRDGSGHRPALRRAAGGGDEDEQRPSVAHTARPGTESRPGRTRHPHCTTMSAGLRGAIW